MTIEEKMGHFAEKLGKNIFQDEELGKIAVLAEYAGTMHQLSQRAYSAAFQGSFSAGRTHRGLAFGISTPLSCASRYLSDMSGLFEDPYAGKEYTKWHLFKRKRAKKANANIKSVLGRYAIDELRAALHAAEDALKEDINHAFLACSYWNDEYHHWMMRSDDDKAIVDRVFNALNKVRDTYNVLAHKVQKSDSRQGGLLIIGDI